MIYVFTSFNKTTICCTESYKYRIIQTNKQENKKSIKLPLVKTKILLENYRAQEIPENYDCLILNIRG